MNEINFAEGDFDADRSYADWKRRDRLLEVSDTIALVVLGSFEIEQALETLLTAAFPNRIKFEGAFERFATKLDLAKSLGITTPGTHGLLKALNALRNRVAHPGPNNLINSEVMVDDVRDILNAASGVIIRDFDLGKLISRYSFPENLRYIYLNLPSLIVLLIPAQKPSFTPLSIDRLAEALLHFQMNDEQWELKTFGRVLDRPIRIPDDISGFLIRQ